MRKGIVVILTLSLLLALIGPTPRAEAAAQTEREAYIQRVLPGFLGAAGITGEIVTYTDPLSIVDAEDETATLTFVLADNSLVGYLNVFYYDNHFGSTFKRMSDERLERIIRKCDPVSLKLIENDVLLISENAILSLYNRQTERYSNSLNDYEANLYSLHVLNEVEGGRSMRMSGSVNVPTVTANSIIIAYAACVASVINYYNSSSYTANMVDSALYSAYGSVPYASDIWIERGYSYLGGLSCSHASTTYFETVQEEICIYQRPILFQFETGSVVVCKSFSEGNYGLFYLGFMDPLGNYPGDYFYDYSFPNGLVYPQMPGENAQSLVRVHYKE